MYKTFKTVMKQILPKPVTRAIMTMMGKGVVHSPRQTSLEKDGVLNCSIAYNQYGAFCVPLSSAMKSVGQDIYRGQQFEPETVSFIAAQHPEKDIIHAGAYFGDFLPALAASRSGDAHIWTFEPNSESFRCAEITMLLNDIKNVTLQKFGLGSQPTTERLVFFDTSTNRHLGGTSRIEAGSDITDNSGEDIECVRLDDVVPEHRDIGVLHLDIEGFELEALRGAKKLITRCTPTIIIENRDPAVITYLTELGYEKSHGLDLKHNSDQYWNDVYVTSLK